MPQEFHSHSVGLRGALFSISPHLRIAATHLRQNQILPEATGPLSCGAPASQKMEDEQYEADKEGDVNESAGNMKCKKPQQPKNNEYCGDQSKHDINSFYFECAPIKNRFIAHSTDSGFSWDSCLR
jgi:hypothetical protein